MNKPNELVSRMERIRENAEERRLKRDEYLQAVARVKADPTQWMLPERPDRMIFDAPKK